METNDNNQKKDEQDYTLDDIISAMYSNEEFSPEERETLIGETAAMISEAALLRGLDEAGEEAQDAFNTLMESEPNPEEMDVFIQKYIPNYSELIIEELQLFQEMGDEPDTSGE